MSKDDLVPFANKASDGSGSTLLSMDTLILIAFGQAAFQYLHAGCSLGVFDVLHGETGLTITEIAGRSALSENSARRLLLGLVSLGLLVERDGRYDNAPLLVTISDRGEWEVLSSLVAFHAEIVYPGETDFLESLKEGTNVGLRRFAGSGSTLYHRLADNPGLQAVFYRYMHSWSALSIPLLLRSIDFSTYSRIADICGGDATNAMAIARACPGVELTLIELPGNAEIAMGRIRKEGLESRIRVLEADVFRDEFPPDHDCFLFIHVLVIWPREVMLLLLQRACRALPAGGAVVIFSSISSDDAKGPLMAALDTAYFVSIPAGGGMIYSWKDYEECLLQAGFDEVRTIDCESWTPHGIVIGKKI